MRRWAFLAAAAATSLVLFACGSAGSGTSTATEPPSGLVDIGAGLQAPAGLKASVAARGPANVAALAIDSQGRLWLGTAAFTDQGTDGVWVVRKAGASPSEVVSSLPTVLGLLWHGDELYVASARRVDAFSGFDGAQFARRRTVLELPADVGEVNGIVLGPDGRLRLGVSSPCDHCSPPLKWSAAVLSFLPDGSDLRVEASGIRAPIALAYVPGTSDLLVTMNQRDDLGDATPGDWLAQVRPGQNWGFPECYGQGGQGCAGVPAPVATLDKHAAVSGLAIINGELGPAIGESAIVAEWSTGKVLRVPLQPAGDSYTGAPVPFVNGLKSPVAVALDSTGVLFLGDWATGRVYAISGH